MSAIVRLSGGVSVRRVARRVIVHADEVLVVDDVPPTLLDRLQDLRTGVRRDTLLSGADAGDVAEVLALLEGLGYVISEPPTRYRGTHLERQAEFWAASRLPGDATQDVVCAAKIGVLGVGGVGTVVLQHLLAAGVRQFGLVDGDLVAAHNLNRQFLFRTTDIGRPKVDIGGELVRAFHPDCVAHVARRFVRSAGDLDIAFDGMQPDLLVMAADTPPGLIRIVALDWCIAAGAAYIEAGCGLKNGSCGPLLTPTHLVAYRDRLARQTVAPPAPMAASSGPTNTLVGAMVANEILRHLAGLPTVSAGAIVTIDFPRLVTRRTALDLD